MTLPGFYLGFIVRGRSPEWPKTTSFLGGSWGIWCILKHNIEKCYRVCNDFVASGWFFRYSYLYTAIITIFLGGSWAFFFWGGGKLLPWNTLDRTLTTSFRATLEANLQLWRNMLARSTLGSKRVKCLTCNLNTDNIVLKNKLILINFEFYENYEILFKKTKDKLVNCLTIMKLEGF